jgi:hypothetical protein
LALFRRQETSDLTRAIEGLLGDPGKMLALAALADQYRREYDYSVIAQKTLALYRSVLTKEKAHGFTGCF